MDLDKAIQGRRSIREYSERKVSLDNIAEVLDAARFAPAAGNIQNFYFVIVEDKKKRKQIAEACNQIWMEKAPVHIALCNAPGRLKVLYKKFGDHYSVQNCAIASQNIMLKAFSLNLGTCFVGSFNKNKIESLLKIPPKVKVEGIITLGFVKKQEEMPRKLELRRITYFDEFGKNLK
ncbi:MAG: nitroreductase family protein [Candidatus Nanoarchaeia archaeon]